MVTQSRTEIDLRRLLLQCEKLASDAQHAEKRIDWRLAKYLDSLDGKMDTLVKVEKKDEEYMREYQRKIAFLRDIVKASELKNPLDRVLQCQHLLPEAVSTTTTTTRGLHAQVKGSHANELRQQLFGDEEGTTRKRHGRKTDTTKENIDEIMKTHHDMQERVAEEMIAMAQSLKHNSQVAGDIIKADNRELASAETTVEANNAKLKVEAERLEELNKRRCSWAIWIMLTAVCVVFINMIMFIKFFPKKVH